MNVIFTVGHSTRTSDELIEILKSFNVETLIDVRSYPGSRRCPWFGKETFRTAVEASGMAYKHLPDIGGRRTEHDPENHHAGWNEPGFRNYAAYASSSDVFQNGFQNLLELSAEKTSAIMCAEAVWWRCHRRIIADYLINAGREVHHIMAKSKSSNATLTPFAKTNGNTIYYPNY